MAIITEIEGDLFDAPPNSVLLHACNVQGKWGKGIALSFRKAFPIAFRDYSNLCEEYPSEYKTRKAYRKSLVGKAFICTVGHQSSPHISIPKGSYYYVVSLITSEGYGPSRSNAAIILDNTANCINDLRAKLEDLKSKGMPVGEVYAPRLNSGLFKVPWAETKSVLESEKLDMIIVSPSAGRHTVKFDAADGASAAVKSKDSDRLVHGSWTYDDSTEENPTKRRRTDRDPEAFEDDDMTNKRKDQKGRASTGSTDDDQAPNVIVDDEKTEKWTEKKDKGRARRTSTDDDQDSEAS